MKIICIGRNYAEHAKELNNAVSASPVVFLKPKSSLLQGTTFYYPEFTKDLHYECEVVVKICKNGKHIKEKFAKNYYQQITVGIDFTARDLQQQQKEKGLPWEIAKAFDGSAVVGKFIDIPADVQAINFSLHKNNLLVQEGHTKDMLFTIDHIIAYVSQFFSLHTGDLIFTGTPAGVGPVAIGDQLKGAIEQEPLFEMQIK
ncbi:MAG: FAA hydrolase family protein [Chitinophagia bacterium]|jgi:2-keto-4-pentenoate hydratase/2-oxohepta-3-ene-1,7-dioic acid hydratase in catechol pathway|nr:FAA hydrolase family protein [Chitinophagia bacterium]